MLFFFFLQKSIIAYIVFSSHFVHYLAQVLLK